MVNNPICPQAFGKIKCIIWHDLLLLMTKDFGALLWGFPFQVLQLHFGHISQLMPAGLSWTGLVSLDGGQSSHAVETLQQVDNHWGENRRLFVEVHKLLPNRTCVWCCGKCRLQSWLNNRWMYNGLALASDWYFTGRIWNLENLRMRLNQQRWTNNESGDFFILLTGQLKAKANKRGYT